MKKIVQNRSLVEFESKANIALSGLCFALLFFIFRVILLPVYH